MATSEMVMSRVVSKEEWLTKRRELLLDEKKLTRQKDAVSAKRRELPWVLVEKEYVFDTAGGPKTLGDLFAGRSQLIVQHFMFAPGWEEGCVGCSFGADHVDGALPHLENHDVKFVAVSRAPLDQIAAYKQRMGWNFDWVSSGNRDFNYDFNVSFHQEDLAAGDVYYNYDWRKLKSEDEPGYSVFYKDDSGAVFHTYSCYSRGGEDLLTTMVFLDMTPRGRNEHGPNGNLVDWVRYHDQYEQPAAKGCCH